MQGGGDFVPELTGSITDQVEAACAAAKASEEDVAAQYNRKASYTKPKCLQASNLKLAKNALYSCVNQDGATDISGVVYAFVPSHDVALKEANATIKDLESTDFGENALAQRLNLDGVPGELVGKVNHGAVFLIQKRFAATATGGGASSIAVKQGEGLELDFSYMETDKPAVAAPAAAAPVVEAPVAKKQKKK
eukprot:4523378-Prymnesium_polylepis.1